MEVGARDQETRDALARRSASPLAVLSVAPSGWSYDRIDLPSADELMVRFSATRSRDWVEIRVVPLGAPGPVFRKLEHCQVRYRASVAQTGPEGREAVASLVLGIAMAVDARLALSPRASIAEVMGRRRGEPIVFGPTGVRELLMPWIVEGVPLAGGWSLADVYPASRTTLAGPIERALVLDFEHGNGERAIFVLAPHEDRLPSFARGAHLQLGHVMLGRTLTPGVENLRAFVSFVVQLNDHPELELRFGDEQDLVLAEPVALAGEDEVLNLAISSDCGQSCVFCSVKTTAPAFDGGDDTFAAIAGDLVRQARRGVRALRLNGYDPLSYSRVLDVARLATSLGYQTAQIFSPATRLSDRAFAAELLSALPPIREVFVPLYGVSAEVHDAVVGRPGAFELVLRALDHLRELGEERVAILSVLTTKNFGELHALWAFAKARGLAFSAHFPYPSFESRADRYFESAPRHREVADALFSARAGAERRCTPQEAWQILEGIAPCVILRAARAHGIGPAEWLPVQERVAPIPGTEYRDARYRHPAGEREDARGGDAFSAATIPCPHRERCAMRTLCSGHVLRAYVELHGDGELAPVSLREVLERQ